MLEPRATSRRPRGLTILLLFAFSFLFATVAFAQDDPNSKERQRGIELYQQKNYVVAADVLKQVVKRNKTDDVAWSYLGFALLRQPKRIKDASKAFETALTLRPDSGRDHVGLAYSFLWRNKLAGAISEAQRAVAIDSKLFEAHYIIGVARLQSGYPEEARQDAETAIKLNANFASAYLLKSEALVGSLARGRQFPYKRASNTGGSGSGATPRFEPREPGTGLGPRPGAFPDLDLGIGVGPGIGTPVWRTMISAEAAEALETYLRLNPDPEAQRFWSEQLDSLRFYGVSHTKDSGNEQFFVGSQVTTRLRVLKKPEPGYTGAARDAQIIGTVVLWAILAADGTVQHILIVEGLPYGLTEAAVKAARRIQFTPATLDGRPVSTFIQLEYHFNLY